MSYKLNIRKIRRKRGLSQQELADKINISQRMISKYELNIADPSLARLIQIAAILNVSLDELVDFRKMHKSYSDELSMIMNKEDDE